VCVCVCVCVYVLCVFVCMGGGGGWVGGVGSLLPVSNIPLFEEPISLC
jgi:hypothetical protein